MFSPSSPVTGTAQTGLTSPTYTLTADTAPSSNGKQYAITALGGTQTGVEAHAVSQPFTVTMFRPQTFKSLDPVDPVTGQLKSVGRNVYKVLTRKGVYPLSGQAAVVAMVETLIHVPAGADMADPESVRAMLSAHIGVLSAQSAGIGDTCVNGVL